MTSGRFEHVDESLLTLIGRIRLIAFDFDGVFTDNAVWVFEDGREAVRCTRSDGIGLRKLDALGIHAAVISTETNPVVTARSRKIGIRCYQSCSDKRSVLEGLVAELGVTLESTAFLGNDVNDQDCLGIVGLPMVVADAHEDVISLARYRTRARGGHGAVREVCDLFDLVLQGERP